MITTIDADGVALAAAQGLYELSQDQGRRIKSLEEENATLKAQMGDFERRLRALEQGGSGRVEGLSDQPLDQGGWLLLAGLGIGALAVWRRKDRSS